MSPTNVSIFIAALTGAALAEFVVMPALGIGTDLRVSFSGEAKSMAKYGKLDANLSCTEQAAVSKKIADYFAKQAKDGTKNPDFTITKEECEAVMAARAARTATPAVKP